MAGIPKLRVFWLMKSTYSQHVTLNSLFPSNPLKWSGVRFEVWDAWGGMRWEGLMWWKGVSYRDTM